MKELIWVAFYKAKYGDLKDKIIAKYTNGEYSHTELIIQEDDEYFMYSSSPRDKKVRKKLHKWDNCWDYVSIVVTKEQKNIILNFFKKVQNNKYDWAGIFGFILPFQDRENKWFCSEFCSNSLKIIGLECLWDKDPSRIDPNRLYRILKKYQNETDI